MPLPERVSDIPIIEGVQANLCDNVGEGHHQEGEEEEHNGVKEGVEGEGQYDHQTHTEYHCTDLGISPIDHKQNCHRTMNTCHKYL